MDIRNGKSSVCRTRFTLIELLVVVAVIAVLAAMLLPVLTKARYRAQLTSCQSRLHQTGMMMAMYVGDNDTWYPWRKVTNNIGNYNSVPNLKADALDDRPLYRPYMSIDFLQCPLSEIEGLNASTAPSVNTTYEIWAGSPFPTEATGLYREGVPATNGGFKFDVLAADLERNWAGWSGVYNYAASHPDRSGLLQMGNPGAGAPTYFRRWYYNWATNVRGKIDRNFLRADGSVTPYFNLTIGDARLKRVDALNLSTGLAVYAYLPAMD